MAAAFDPFNIWVHGITPEMVADQPRWVAVLPDILELIGSDVVIAHNAGFDIGVIRYACRRGQHPWPAMRFVCTLVMARRTLTLPSYRLPFVTDALGLAMGQHHDPLEDARAVTQVVSGLAARADVSSVEDLAAALQIHIGRMDSGQYEGSISLGGGGLTHPDVNPAADPSGYLYGRAVSHPMPSSVTVTSQIPESIVPCTTAGEVPEWRWTLPNNVLVA